MSARTDSGLAYEALIALSMVRGAVPLARFADGAELGRRFKQLPDRVRGTIKSLDAGQGLNWADLVGLVQLAAPPRAVPDLKRLVESMRPVDLKLAMLGYHDVGYREDIGVAPFKAAATSGGRAVKRFQYRAARARRFGVVGPLVTLPPDLVAERTIDVLDELPEDFYVLRRTDQQVIAGAAAQASGLARTMQADAMVEKLTRGIVYDEKVENVLLVPTVIHRPWTLILDHDASKIFCFPVDARETEQGEPDPDMVAVYRALSDATRLRILHRLAAGRATFGQLSRDLGLAKSTLHQHALILRRAGLVRLNLDSGLELNPNRASLDRLLSGYLSS